MVSQKAEGRRQMAEVVTFTPSEITSAFCLLPSDLKEGIPLFFLTPASTDSYPRLFGVDGALRSGRDAEDDSTAWWPPDAEAPRSGPRPDPRDGAPQTRTDAGRACGPLRHEPAPPRRHRGRRQLHGSHPARPRAHAPRGGSTHWRVRARSRSRSGDRRQRAEV